MDSPANPHPAQFGERPNQFTDYVTREQYSLLCTSCGMCCLYFATPLFGLNLWDGEEVAVPRRLVQVGPRHSFPTGNSFNRYLRVVQDPVWGKGYHRCAALKGKQGISVECGVYDRRPKMCSIFEPGSDYCMRVRKWGSQPNPDVELLGPS